MCGIAGIIDRNGTEPGIERTGAWSACMDRLRRRGPDGDGSWISPTGRAALMHTRLAIVDPSERGHQPMTSPCGRVAITYNGEIYNAPALRRRLESLGYAFVSSCDTEVILAGWMHWGEGVIDELRGMFALVIWDDRCGELLAAVDHAGMKPMVWSIEGERFVFASDTDALRALTGGGGALDPMGVRHVLTMGCCPGETTMWRGVRRLGAGRVLRWSPGGAVRVRRYWSPPEETHGVRMDDDTFAARFEDVARGHLLSDVPVGVLLSGGVDSASIACAATRVGARPSCFTLAMDGADDESADACRLGSALGLECDVAPSGWDLEAELGVYARAFDEPQGFSALLTQSRICAHAGRRVKAILGGDGGDECFGGYLWQQETGAGSWGELHRDRAWAREASAIRALLDDPGTPDGTRNRAGAVLGSCSFVHGYLSRALPGFHPAESLALTRSMGGAYDESSCAAWLEHEDRPAMAFGRRVQRLDLVGFCAASILPKVDRASMHCGLEVRAPMLDRDLLEYGIGRSADRAGEPDRAELRRYIASVVGGGVVRRAKQGFSLRRDDELTQWRRLSERVADSKLVRGGYLRADWKRFVPVGAVYRLRTVCMLSAWAECRL